MKTKKFIFVICLKYFVTDMTVSNTDQFGCMTQPGSWVDNVKLTSSLRGFKLRYIGRRRIIIITLFARRTQRNKQ